MSGAATRELFRARTVVSTRPHMLRTRRHEVQTGKTREPGRNAPMQLFISLPSAQRIHS
jgi:hypothetical protein